MKIGIVTFHNALNVGAVLQAYALQILLTQLGHQVEFINYKPIRKYRFRNYIAKSPIVLINKWRNIYNGKKYTRQDKFNKILNLSPRVYLNYEDLRKDPMDYDIYIAGSDQIWNFYQSISPIYMLDFVPENKKKISYSASMGQCSIDESLHSAFRDKLIKFNAISLREKNGVDFVNNLLNGEKLAIQTLDPTLLVDSSNYNNIMESQKIIENSYICTYILAELDKENAEIISYIKRQLSLKIINLRNPDTCIWLSHAKNIIVSPEKWLYYIKNSDFVICSSFHAVVFCLIFHKPFIALVPPNFKANGGNMRINTLLEDTGLLYRIIPNFDKERINNIIKNLINWNEVDRKIESMRESSIEFLISNLK